MYLCDAYSRHAIKVTLDPKVFVSSCLIWIYCIAIVIVSIKHGFLTTDLITVTVDLWKYKQEEQEVLVFVFIHM